MLNNRERMYKFDPYELCPCGANKKFKFCCYKKAKSDQRTSNKYKDYSDSRMQHLIKKTWRDTDFKICLAFNPKECDSLIKNAHTLQNNRILNRISENGHVYTLVPITTRKGVSIELKKISRNKASTFFGFCDYHDNQLFKPIEQEAYLKEPIQNFLFAFRGFCLEYHKLIRKLETVRTGFELNPSSMLDPNGIHFYRIAEFDVNDSKAEYEQFRSIYKNEELDNIITVERRLDYEIGFAVSSSFAVKNDLYGNEINDIYSIKKELLPSIYINVFPAENETIIIMSYNIEYEKEYGKYFKQIKNLTNEELEKHLNFLIINYTENVFFSPRLIKKLEEKEKVSLLSSFESSVDINTAYELLKDGEYFKFNLFLKS